MLKVAYICEPQVGGTYTSFRQVRERLLPLGIDYRCVPPFDRQAFSGTRFEHDEGVDYLDLPEGDPAGMARRLVDHLQSARFAALVILPGCYPFVTSLPPFLPRDIRCLARMPHNARGVYAPTALIAPHCNRIIAVGPRLKSDLVSAYRVPADQVTVISNGVDVKRLLPGEGADPRRAIFVGRIEDVQKNVFLLPRILARARTHDPSARLTVVGSGPDLEPLRRRFETAGLAASVDLRGRVDHAELPALLQRHGVFVLPSRFEGCSNSTLEAMACGCVPVLSRLPGITDHVAEPGCSGFLLAPDDWRGMGDAWGRLMADAAEWQRYRQAARARVEAEFSLDRMAAGYAQLFQTVAAEPDPRPQARPLAEYAVHPGLGPTWRRWIPEALKKRLRTWAARFGWSP